VAIRITDLNPDPDRDTGKAEVCTVPVVLVSICF